MSFNGQGSKRRRVQEAGRSNRRSAIANDTTYDSEPELYGDELEGDRRVFNSATERDRHTAAELVRVTLISEQCAEHGPAILQQTLCLLGQYFPGIPKDPRTALEGLPGPCNIETSEVQGGVYWHRGLEAGIRANRASENKELRFDVHFGEVSLAQLANPGLLAWVIQARLHEGTRPPGDPFVVGVFCGDSRPPCGEFLGPFSEEAARLCASRLTVNGYSLTVKPRAVIADVAAREFIKGTVPQNSCYGCTKCTIKGEVAFGSTISFFDQRNTSPRTNEAFRSGVYASTHQQVADGPPVVTPLARMPIDIVQDVTIGDDRQLLQLGVAKILISAFINGLGNVPEMEETKHKYLQKLICKVRLPHERQPRRFGRYIAHWPHTTWGSFLDAVGIVVLKSVISDQYYINYCRLHWAIAICNSRRYRHLLNYARRLLHQFVAEHQNMVGYVTASFHQLLHVVDEVVKFGPLPLQSASPFKAAVSGLNHKVDITKTAPPMQQIARALLLREAARRPTNPLPPIPIPTDNGRRVKIRKQFVLRCESISADDTDSWFLAPGGQVVKFQRASADPFVVYGKPLTEPVASFIHPVAVPDELNWFAAKNKANLHNTTEYRLKDIICKLCVIWADGDTAFVPLPESFAES